MPAVSVVYRRICLRGAELASPTRERHVTVAHRIIEILIGRLITDEKFRREFLQDPEATLFALSDRGLVLSRIEIAASPIPRCGRGRPKASTPACRKTVSRMIRLPGERGTRARFVFSRDARVESTDRTDTPSLSDIVLL